MAFDLKQVVDTTEMQHSDLYEISCFRDYAEHFVLPVSAIASFTLFMLGLVDNTLTAWAFPLSALSVIVFWTTMFVERQHVAEHRRVYESIRPHYHEFKKWVGQYRRLQALCDSENIAGEPASELLLEAEEEIERCRCIIEEAWTTLQIQSLKLHTATPVDDTNYSALAAFEEQLQNSSPVTCSESVTKPDRIEVTT